MAQCCADAEGCLLIDTFDDGRPLTANYKDPSDSNSPYQMTLAAGEGLNASGAAKGTTDSGYISAVFTTDLGLVADATGNHYPVRDHCGNPRRAFAMGCRFDFSNRQAADDSIMEIRGAGMGSEYMLALVITSGTEAWPAGLTGPDLIVITGAEDGGNECYRVKNVVDPTTLASTGGRYIEIRGEIASENEDFSFNPDGWIEVRIDGRVYDNNADFAALQTVADLPEPCGPVTNQLFATANSATDPDYRGGWNKIYIQPQGRIDCVYVRETAAFCDEEDERDVRPGDCDPPGPGGSSFNGSPHGDRLVHPGGYVATYSAPTYGGVPATASDPTDAQMLTGATGLAIGTKITLPSGTVKRYAQRAIVRSGSPAFTTRVNRYGPIPFRLADRFGNIPSQTYEIELADHDGEIRALLASDSTDRFWTRWLVENEISTDAGRLAGTAPNSLSRGLVIAPPVTGDQTVTLQVGDELTRQYGRVSLDRELPWVRMRDVYQAGLSATGMIYTGGLPEAVADDVLPILYGEASDDIRQQDGLTPVGIVPLTYAGTFTLLSGSQTWYGFVVSLYAIKDATGGGLYASNLHACPGSVRIDPDRYSDDWLVPGKGQWSTYFSTNYHDITINSTTYRVTMIFGRGAVAQQHVDGMVPISVNAFGIETTGDSTGTLITDAAYIRQHLLDHPVLRRTTSGSWGAVGTFTGGTAKVRTTAFLATKTIHGQRLAAGYPQRLILDRARPAKDWLADQAVSADIRDYLNHHGQVVATTLDDASAVSSLTTFTELRHIKDGSFQILPERNGDVENVQPYQYGPEPATGRFVGSDTKKAATAITNWGEERQADPLVFEGIYTAAVAADVTSRRQLVTIDGIARGVFVMELGAAMDLVLGQLIRLTHRAGFGQLGWTDRILRVVGRIANPNVSDPVQDDDLTATIEWEDVQMIVSTAAGTDSGVGFNPVNLEADSSAGVVGSEASGTAKRVA